MFPILKLQPVHSALDRVACCGPVLVCFAYTVLGDLIYNAKSMYLAKESG